MEPVIQRLQAEGYPVRKVDIDQHPQLAAQYGVTSVPCFVMLSDGREVDRVVGAVGYDRLASMITAARVPIGSAAAGTPEIRGQSPDRTGLGGRLRQLVGGRNDHGAPPQPSTTPPDVYPAIENTSTAPAYGGPEPPAALSSDLGAPSGLDASPTAAPVPAMAPSFGASREMPPAAPTAMSTSMPAAIPAAIPSLSPEQQALAASVRLRVDDGNFFSYATGTIIALRPQGEALILTCGHVFRDSQGRGAITVDLFGSQRQGPIPGRLVAYDLNRDLGLVSVTGVSGVSAVRIASPDSYLREGLRVFSVGCDRGAEPSLRECRLVAINRYLGTPNLVATNRPVVGRSGGGLFDSQGQLIGVCRAADGQVDEGVYVSFQAIADQLKEWRIDDVLQTQPQPLPLAQGTSPSAPIEPMSPVAVSPDRPADFDYTQVPPETARLGVSTEPASASSNFDATSEPVFIVRGRSPGEGDVMILERPSPAFLAQLARESAVRVPASGQLTAAVRSVADAARLSQATSAPVVRGQSPSFDASPYARTAQQNR